MRMRDIKPGMAVSTKNNVLQGITIGKPRPGVKCLIYGHAFRNGKIRYIQDVQLTDGRIFTLRTDHLKKL